VIDAIDFLPQSRPRLFIIGVLEGMEIPENLTLFGPDPNLHPARLLKAHRKLSQAATAKWIWWALPMPPKRKQTFLDLIEDNPTGIAWHTAEETQRLLQMMSDLNLQKVENAKKAGRRMVGGIYKRIRVDETGRKAQRAEVRFDEVAGCLRTPLGGSSRQIILTVHGNDIRSRLLSPREAARLMGLPEEYKLPEKYNEAYHIAGDGVAVPVVRFLSAHILEPVLAALPQAKKTVSA
jgi:DNA (cytosine-5)-methyltransferase 1